MATTTETGRLMDYATAKYLREATAEETHESIVQASIDGGAGVIVVEGRRVYVEGGHVAERLLP